ncbi:MAG: hypothetical protein IJO06_11200, partial [Thermoguttaceae bacterium]|nr:hypothetical protein [Thermoguttaceae bacterium]
ANPNFKEEAAYVDWAAWLDAWVANAQARLEGSAANLQEYLDSYLTAVDKRDAALKSAQADYAAGKTSLTDFLKKRAEIRSSFSQTTTEARADLAAKDAAVDETYREGLKSLNDAYDKLAASGEIGAPGSIRDEAKEAAGELSASTESTDANFHLKNTSTGAKVATDLTSVLKLWRSGYSSSTIYDEIYGGGFDAEDGETGKDETGDGDKDESGDGDKDETGDGGKDESGDGDKDETGDGDKDETGDGDKNESGDGGKDETGDGGKDETGDGGKDESGDGDKDETGDGGKDDEDGNLPEIDLGDLTNADDDEDEDGGLPLLA